MLFALILLVMGCAKSSTQPQQTAPIEPKKICVECIVNQGYVNPEPALFCSTDTNQVNFYITTMNAITGVNSPTHIYTCKVVNK